MNLYILGLQRWTEAKLFNFSLNFNQISKTNDMEFQLQASTQIRDQELMRGTKSF